MRRIIGVDLGTSNSCVAILDDTGQAIVIPDTQGNRTTPSIFAISSTEERLVGEKAKQQADTNRLNTIFGVKRLIGKKFHSKAVSELAAKLPYKIIPASNGDAWIEINAAPTSPEEVSAQILVRMKEIAESYLGEPVHHAVITVPAHFNDAERQATKDAGKIAGLQVLRIINEPTAAALAYGIDLLEEDKKKDGTSDSENSSAEKKDKEHLIAVFDLGGGTFDVTILGLKNGTFDVKSTGGDTCLGGEDFDLLIMNHLLTTFKAKEGIDLSSNKVALQRLKEAAKQAKHDLSATHTVEVVVPYISQGMAGTSPRDLRIRMDRKTLDQIVGPLLVRLDEPCFTALADAGLQPGQIDDVILVGGMTRMPAIKHRCQKIFGRKPNDTINPDEAIATGAAVQAGLLEGVLKGMQLVDVIPLSLGIATQGGTMTVLLPRNSKVPSKVTEIFTTSGPDQRQLSIKVLQGEHSLARHNKLLGTFELRDIHPAPRGVPKIPVTVEVDEEGIVHVSAKDIATGEEQQIEVIATSGLGNDDIDMLMRENRRYAAKKKAAAEKNSQKGEDQANSASSPTPFDEATATATVSEDCKTTQYQLMTIVFETQFKLDMEGKKFKGPKRGQLEECLAQARSVLKNSTDMSELQKILLTLQDQAQQLEQYLEAA